MTENNMPRKNIKLVNMSLAVVLSLVLSIANSDNSKKLEPITPKSLVVNDYVLVRKESRKAGVVGKPYAVTEFVIDYENNKLTRLSEYPNGIDNLTANTVFVFDGSGNLISQQDIDDRGTASVRQFVYDSDGQLTNFNGFMASNGNPSATWEYSYLPNGNIKRKIETSGEPAKAKTYEYDEKSRLSAIVHQRVGRAGVFKDTYIERFEHHPVTGQIANQESFSIAGVSFGVSSSYSYDEHGNMIKIDWYKGDELTHTDQFYYELKPQPIFNYWLHINRFFPEWMRYEV